MKIYLHHLSQKEPLMSGNTHPFAPNDSIITPNEPTDNLPASTRGKIQELTKNPEIEAKRKANHQAAMQLNRNNWKTGKYSTNYPVPDMLIEHLEALESLSLTQPSEARDAIASLARSNLKRIARLEYFESVKGTENASLSRLIKDTALILKHLDNSQPSLGFSQQNNVQFSVTDVRGLSDNDRAIAREWVQSKLDEIESNKHG
jgi:hypothetical protein